MLAARLSSTLRARRAYLERARIARDQGQPSMAFQDLDRAIQLDPAYAAAHAERAALYTQPAIVRCRDRRLRRGDRPAAG